jgi:hypothetical protein
VLSLTNEQRDALYKEDIKDEAGNTQIFTACKKTKDIDRFLVQGTTLLKIKRVGTGMLK